MSVPSARGPGGELSPVTAPWAGLDALSCPGPPLCFQQPLAEALSRAGWAVPAAGEDLEKLSHEANITREISCLNGF